MMIEVIWKENLDNSDPNNNSIQMFEWSTVKLGLIQIFDSINLLLIVNYLNN